MVNIRIKPVIYLFLKTDENQKKKQIKMHCWRLSLVCNCAQGERLGLPLATITLLATFFISCFLSFHFPQQPQIFWQTLLSRFLSDALKT